jgi:light-regulated signal transduction histidine kinase (bacteriophytochrome)
LIGSVNARSRRAQDQIIKILQSVTDGFIVFDTNWRYLYLNDNAVVLARKSRKELLGTVVWEQFPDTTSILYVECHRAMAENTPRHFEYFYLPFEQWFECRAYPSKRGLALYVNDITPRKQAAAITLEYHEELEQRVKDRTQELEERARELARSNAELQQFAYVASHDLQEPLRMVTSYTQLLASRYDQKLGSEADYFLKYIVEGATRMGKLIEDILAYSLFDPKKKDYKMIDCEAVLTSALRNLENSIQESGAKITHDSLPAIEGVPAQLTQVFQNLIGNAIKFRSAESPEIHISAERPFQVPNNSMEWLFSVRDNGIGLPQEYGEQIFDVFKRLHLRHEYPGTGIGLAICKKVIEGHAGRIWVKSQHGKGSTFFFTIPSKGENNGHA